MRKALAFRHVAFEGLGLFETVLEERGFAIETIDIPLVDLECVNSETPDLLIVLGGPIGVYETAAYPFLSKEIPLLSARLRRGRPTLGICLGAQLIAAALGARVYPGNQKEIGFAPVALTEAGRKSVLSELGQGASVLHWHGDTFELPPSACRLAETPAYANQAFSIGASVLALQFHLEVSPAMLESWLVGHAVELAQAKIDPRELRSAARRHDDALRAAARRIFLSWLDDLR